MKKYKEKYKTGMIFRSKKYPWTDFVIDFVSYIRGSETAYTFNMNSIIDWVRINEEAFDKHISVTKGIDYIDTEHILCSSCYKRELQHETYIHMVNESGDREIHCAVCDKEHIISEKEFEGQIEKTCCAEKCIIF